MRIRQAAWTGLVLLCKDVSTKGYGGQPLSADIVSRDAVWHTSEWLSKSEDGLPCFTNFWVLHWVRERERERERQVQRQVQDDSRISWAFLAKFDVFFSLQGCQNATATILFRLWQPPTADIHLDLSQRWLCDTCRQVPRVRAMQTNGCQCLTTFRRCFRHFSTIPGWRYDVWAYVNTIDQILQSRASTS